MNITEQLTPYNHDIRTAITIAAGISGTPAGVFSSLVSTGDIQLRSTSLETIANERFSDHVASGMVWTADSVGTTRNASMTAGVVYINGRRVSVSAVVARLFTASVDTYIDVDTTGAITYTTAANNAASPALVANNIRIGIIVTGASSIATVGSINQGQDEILLPIAGGFPYAVTDSLGNRICRRNATESRLGFSAKYTQGTLLPITYTTYCQVIARSNGRSVDIDIKALVKDANSGAARTGHVRIQVDGTTLTGSDIIWGTAISGGYANLTGLTASHTPTAGLHTWTLQVVADTASASNLDQASIKVTQP